MTNRTEASMTNVEIIRRSPDPLGYEGDVLDRLRAMAEDELAGIGEAAVEEEAAVLRARLSLGKGGEEGARGHDVDVRFESAQCLSCVALVDEDDALAVAPPFGFERPHELQDRGLAEIAATGPLPGIHSAGDPGVELLAVVVPGVGNRDPLRDDVAHDPLARLASPRQVWISGRLVSHLIGDLDGNAGQQ